MSGVFYNENFMSYSNEIIANVTHLRNTNANEAETRKKVIDLILE